MLKWLIGLVALKASPEKTGITFLKSQLKSAGIPPDRVPIAAMEEIVKADLAKAQATANFAAHLPELGDQANWKTNFASNIEVSVTVLSLILRGDRSPLAENAELQSIVSRYNITL
jgi:hypothetical protein